MYSRDDYTLKPTLWALRLLFLVHMDTSSPLKVGATCHCLSSGPCLQHTVFHRHIEVRKIHGDSSYPNTLFG